MASSYGIGAYGSRQYGFNPYVEFVCPLSINITESVAYKRARGMVLPWALTLSESVSHKVVRGLDPLNVAVGFALSASPTYVTVKQMAAALLLPFTLGGSTSVAAKFSTILSVSVSAAVQEYYAGPFWDGITGGQVGWTGVNPSGSWQEVPVPPLAPSEVHSPGIWTQVNPNSGAWARANNG